MDEAELERLITRVIGCLIEVHRSLGPGFLESVYHRALEVELECQGIPFQTEKEIMLTYRGREIGTHRLDLLVQGELIVEDDQRWRDIYEDVLSGEGYVLHSAISYGEARGWLQREEIALAIVDLHLISSAAPADNRDGFWLLRAAQQGGALAIPLEFTVHAGTLDPVDIPAGPWGHTIDVPWDGEEAAAWNHTMAIKSVKKLREYGFTTASGLPVVTLRGFNSGVPDLDFSAGDAQMKMFREAGFTMPVVSYCALNGLNTYYKDEGAMRAAGMTDYSQFIKAVFGAVQSHADKAGWLPVYWNIGDEPIGDDLTRGIENAAAYRKAFPKGPPYFTAASSFPAEVSMMPNTPSP